MKTEPVLVETLEFPTDIIEHEWAVVRIYSHAGQNYASLIFPQEKYIGEDVAIRLEDLALNLFREKQSCGNKLP